MLKSDIKVGCKGLLNTQWSTSFYPDDLPQQWALDYYSNEFFSILLDYKQAKEYLEEFATDTDFFIVIEQKIKQKEITINKGVSVIIDYVSDFEQLSDFDYLKKTNINNGKEYSIYSYYEKVLLKPLQLKSLLDYCINDSGVEQCPEGSVLYLFFDDNSFAIDNTRNMNTLLQLL